MDDYSENNIYYSPQATTQWIVQRQNPAGYFVTNPDMLFEPSQLNNSTLRGTRYAISTLGDLDGLYSINRLAVIDFILGLYETEIKQSKYPPAKPGALIVNRSKRSFLRSLSAP
ncbi:MAG: hypothetical protein ABW145_04785 [Candidatus Thiodiazotropha sp.]